MVHGSQANFSQSEHTLKCLAWKVFFCFSTLLEEAQDLEKLNQTLLISLGSHCEVAWYLRENQKRTAAFPFDWLLTLDHQGFISLLENDFTLFMDQMYLQQHPRGNVIHTKYNIDFRHDWSATNFRDDFANIREKYERRIKRFQQLNEYRGKVYFVRSAFDLNLDASLPTITSECERIDAAQAVAIRNILSQKFSYLFSRRLVRPPLKMGSAVEQVFQASRASNKKSRHFLFWRFRVVTTLLILSAKRSPLSLLDP